jgi:hypothetical protein
MKRLVTTSRGPVAIDLEGQISLVGTQVTLTGFGADGWEDAVGVWAGKHGQGTLAEFMTTYIQIPKPEAEELAKDVLGPWLDEWAARGGEEEARKIKRWSRWFSVGVAVVVALALAGLVALVLLLVTRL